MGVLDNAQLSQAACLMTSDLEFRLPRVLSILGLTDTVSSPISDPPALHLLSAESNS